MYFLNPVLIPMYFMIGLWGGSDRVYAALKFFLYTLFGSVLFLIAALYLWHCTGVTSIVELSTLSNTIPSEIRMYLWIAFFIAFAIKVPMWPLHTWLPDAHVQAPTAGSIMLAGVLLKLGGYGFVRFLLPIFPHESVYFSNFVFCMSGIAAIYASLVAIAQTDIKKMIAYSSVAHMGFVTAGMFSFNHIGIAGAIFQMFSHGIISAALFFSVGVMYDRMHTRLISDYSGIVHSMPNYSVFLMFFVMASIGLPGTSGFVSEFLVMLGVYSVSKITVLAMLSSIVLGAVYMLWLYKRVIFGNVINQNIKSLKDLYFVEKISFLIMIIIVLFLGVYPNLILRYLDHPVGLIITLFK